MSTRINVRWVASLLITKRAKEERTKQKKEIKGKIKQMAMAMGHGAFLLHTYKCASWFSFGLVCLLG